MLVLKLDNGNGIPSKKLMEFGNEDEAKKSLEALIRMQKTGWKLVGVEIDV